MKLNFYVSGQNISCQVPKVIVSDTIRYLEANFVFMTNPWKGLNKWAHFAVEGKNESYDILLEENKIPQSFNLALSAGKWSVWVHGDRQKNGEIEQRITTDKCFFEVEQSGELGGEVFPNFPPDAVGILDARVTHAMEVADSVRRDADEGKFDPVRGVDYWTPEDQKAVVDEALKHVQNGADGFSPTVEVTETENGHEVSITDINGTKTFEVENGEQGKEGPEGKQGEPGKDGEPGKNGKSAYEYAVDGGFHGDEQDFSEKLANEFKWIGEVDDPEEAMARLTDEGKYRFEYDGFIYTVETQRPDEYAIGQSYWFTEEGFTLLYSRTGYRGATTDGWTFSGWTVPVTFETVDALFSRNNHVHYKASSISDFENWIEAYTEGEQRVYDSSTGKYYIVKQWHRVYSSEGFINYAQQYFEFSEPWKVYSRTGTKAITGQTSVTWGEWELSAGASGEETSDGAFVVRFDIATEEQSVTADKTLEETLAAAEAGRECIAEVYYLDKFMAMCPLEYDTTSMYAKGFGIIDDGSHIKYSINQFTIGFYGDAVNNNYISVKQLSNNENKTVLSSRNIVTNATAPNGLLANLTYTKIKQYDEIRVNVDGVDYDCIPEYGTDPNGDKWVKLGGTARFAKNEPFSITAFDGNDAAIIAFDKSGDHIISAIGLDVAYNSYVVLASPNGTKYQITVSDGGALSATAI